MKEIKMEFILKTSKKLLYNRISTPSGLSDWFADNVTINNKIFSFFWDDYEEKAKIVTKKKEKFVKFKWLDSKNKYFEFKIKAHQHSKELSLLITDFVDDDEDTDGVIDLWSNQIETLKRNIGVA